MHEDLKKLNQGYCPDCDGNKWKPGSRGGLAQNIQCLGCGSKFNIARHNGKIIFKERL